MKHSALKTYLIDAFITTRFIQFRISFWTNCRRNKKR